MGMYDWVFGWIDENEDELVIWNEFRFVVGN